jgi:hypothetical protein
MSFALFRPHEQTAVTLVYPQGSDMPLKPAHPGRIQRTTRVHHRSTNLPPKVHQSTTKGPPIYHQRSTEYEVAHLTH